MSDTDAVTPSTDSSDNDALWAELVTLTGWSRERWQSIKTMSPELQQAMLKEAGDQNWTDPSTSLGTKVLGILTTLGIIGGAVGSVAGAAGAVKAL
jgi:hypothetical protein